MILHDSSTYTFAKLKDWEYPVSREWLALADIWEILLASNVKKKDFKPYPRPYKEKENASKKTYGDVKTLSQEEVRNRLKQMNPQKEK